jgi:hypothetical protein
MRQQKDVKTAPADTDAGGVELRVLKNQSEVRAVLGGALYDNAVEEARQMFRGATGNPGEPFVFLVFTETGRGKIWMTDKAEQDANSDDDEVIIVKQKLEKRFGHAMSERIWLAAKKLKGWPD